MELRTTLGRSVCIDGQYLIWGRFIADSWKKRRIIYAVTDRRALVITHFNRVRTISALLVNVTTIEKDVRQDGIGTLTVGASAKLSFFSSSRNQSWSVLGLDAGVPVFVDIDEANEVMRILQEARSVSIDARQS